MEIREVADGRISEPGAYRMPEAAYHADPCPVASLSSGIGQLLLNASPLHAWYAHPRLNPDWEPDESKRHFALGSACHRLLLGAGSELVIIDAANYRTKAAQEERDSAAARGAVPVLIGEYQEAERIVAAARTQLDPILPRAMKEGHGEVVIATDFGDGLWARCMTDWWSDDGLTVTDYKTTQALASASAFTRRVPQMGYDFQDAFYQAVIEDAFPKLAGRLEFIFVVQEINPPYPLALYQITEADRTVARRRVGAAIDMWSRCIEKNHWPGYPAEVQMIELPDWHQRAWLDREEEERGNGAANL